MEDLFTPLFSKAGRGVKLANWLGLALSMTLVK